MSHYDGGDGINTGIVDITNANRRVWLVRIPEYLAERLAEIDDERDPENLQADEDDFAGNSFRKNAAEKNAGVEIGAVRVVFGTGETAGQVNVQLAPNGPCGDLPLEYQLQLNRCEQSMYVFAAEDGECASTGIDPYHANPNAHAIAVEGRVEYECNLKPVLNDAYRQVMRRREENANRPKRTIRVLEESERHQIGLIPHVREQDLLARRKMRFEPDLRRERLPREEVTDILFRAFERTTHWSFKALVDHTKQPSSFLKEILNDIAIYNTRGPYKNFYELKSEYKQR